MSRTNFWGKKVGEKEAKKQEANERDETTTAFPPPPLPHRVVGVQDEKRALPRALVVVHPEQSVRKLSPPLSRSGGLKRVDHTRC